MKNKEPRQSKVRYESSIVDGEIFFEDVRQCTLDGDIAAELLDDPHLRAIRVVSLAHNWYERAWYTEDVQLNEDIKIEMTLRKERRGQLDHWYAYRRCLGTLYKRYVGHSDQITERKLLDIARSLPSA